MLKLGERVKDKITGFEGVAVARCEYLNGCISIQVQPTELKDGNMVKPAWIDETQLAKSKAKVGGPQERPPAISPPS